MQQRVLDFIESGGSSEPFERLALDVFAFQYQRIDLYRRLCDSRSATPDSVHDWRQIPAIPADAFKQPLGLPDPGGHVFESSGTTQGPEQRSIHELTSLDTYRRSSLRHFEHMVLPDAPGPMDVLVLGPTATTHPRSSLGRMFSWCAEAFGDQVEVAFDAAGRTDIDRAIECLDHRSHGHKPVLVLAITSALSALFSALKRRNLTLRLPADSRIVDTGGNKGRPGVLSPAGVLKAGWRYLHVPSYLSVNEYGMTEMLSQFYDDALLSRFRGWLRPRAKIGPVWVRTTVVDPATLEPVSGNRPGILRHLDLANWETLSAIQTLDVGRSVGAGFQVLGRAIGADRRGCSELLATIEAPT